MVHYFQKFQKCKMGIKNAEFDAELESVGKVAKNSCEF
jgi:hypothetical protein